jgi:amino acid transporter
MSLQVYDGFEHRTYSVARSLRLTETIFSFLLEAVKFLHSVAIAVNQFIRLEEIKAYDSLSALPFSGFLYRINRYTQTPVNTVWFDAIFAILLGCLAFAGAQAINAIFALSVTALYVAYSIPISARIFSKTNFKPGPFTLGIWVSKVFLFIIRLLTFCYAECSCCSPGRLLYDIHDDRLLIPNDTSDFRSRNELHGCSVRRSVASFTGMVLPPGIRRRALVHRTYCER